MSNFLTEFRDTRDKYTQLRNQAEKAMQTEFNEALDKAAQIYKDFSEEFGGKLKLPASVLKFTVNTAKTRKKRAPKVTTTTAAPAGTPAEPSSEPIQISGKKLAGLKKSFKSLTGKIAAAKAEGKPTRDLEDDLYQVTDELTLAGVDTATLTAEAPAPETVIPAPPPPVNLGPVHPF